MYKNKPIIKFDMSLLPDIGNFGKVGVRVAL